jgi:hypothetical protein
MPMKKPRKGSLPATDVVPEKIDRKKFKPIPADAPARELAEYLRAMICESDASLDRIAKAGRMSKNTLTTTMDGRSKEWPSVQNWITAYSEAVRGPSAEQMQEIHRRFRLGRDNHLAEVRRHQTAKAAAADASAAAMVAEPPVMVDPEHLWQPSPESLLTEVYIRLPKRTPGAGINTYLKQFLTEDEIEARIATIKRLERQRRLREGPTPLQENRWFASAVFGRWSRVYRSAVVYPADPARRAAPAVTPARRPTESPLAFGVWSSDEPDGPAEPTTSAPAGSSDLPTDLESDDELTLEFPEVEASGEPVGQPTASLAETAWLSRLANHPAAPRPFSSSPA